MVSRSGFGAIPIQRISFEESARLLRKAYSNGINFFDTAQGYTDSEEKIGKALSDVRQEIVLATKAKAHDGTMLREQLARSLKRLGTDYIDIYQVHNPARMPRPGDENGIYDALLEARCKGQIRFIGLTNHHIGVAREAVESGLYDTVQFPFSSLSSQEDMDLMEASRQRDIGFIAMKGLAGGLLTNARSTFTFIRSLDWPVPIWGLEKEWQLDEFLALERNPPVMDKEMEAVIAQDRADLAQSFCRGCGYCLPCPAGIEINFAARVTLLMRRMPAAPYMTPDFQAKMTRIRDCTECGQCRDRCPYGLDPPAMLKVQLKAYEELLGTIHG
jgi:predicted aldo/keto reductase-like oxidoreductase